ncbi:MAG TPA: hypothetical protein VN678_01600 [Acidobacteriaceae bacterium]|nr:hypothetical protein [Acidobacteriaceae bacterium]
MDKTTSWMVARATAIAISAGLAVGLIATAVKFGVHLGVLLDVLRFWLKASSNLFTWPLVFQGPAATAAVVILWITVARGVRPQDVGFWKQGALLSGLFVITLATLLDWISIVADYRERYPAAVDPATYDMTENVTKAVSILCGLAIILAAVGRGKGKARTVFTSILLLVASLEMGIMEGCRGISF